jgi:hypothetical protein
VLSHVKTLILNTSSRGREYYRHNSIYYHITLVVINSNYRLSANRMLTHYRCMRKHVTQQMSVPILTTQSQPPSLINREKPWTPIVLPTPPPLTSLSPLHSDSLNAATQLRQATMAVVGRVAISAKGSGYAVVASLCATYRPPTTTTLHLSIVPRGKEGKRKKEGNSPHRMQRISLSLAAKVPTNRSHGNPTMTDIRTNKPMLMPMRMQAMNVHITYIHPSLIYPVPSPASCR